MFWSYRQIEPWENMSQRKWKFDYITLLSCSKNARQSWTSEAKKYAKFSAWVLDLSNLSQGNRRSCCFRNNDEKQVSQSRIAVFFWRNDDILQVWNFFLSSTGSLFLRWSKLPRHFWPLKKFSSGREEKLQKHVSKKGGKCNP